MAGQVQDQAAVLVAVRALVGPVELAAQLAAVAAQVGLASVGLALAELAAEKPHLESGSRHQHFFVGAPLPAAGRLLADPVQGQARAAPGSPWRKMMSARCWGCSLS